MTDSTLDVWANADGGWVPVDPCWQRSIELSLDGLRISITFKEIETEEELERYEQLRQFHYRGGGGAGRTVPIIGVAEVRDLPSVIGFVELTSSMIANSARSSFFSAPYRENGGVGWTTWDRKASKSYSNIICRISRFVIHPELRGLGLATPFLEAARSFALERWRFGGFRARFLEITADMLRYYPFLDSNFAAMGETEGNGHRVSKDMKYLVRKALTSSGVKAMPQGGGGVMTMQRAYAIKLLNHMSAAGASLEDAVQQLKYEPEKLDQASWEALHKLNRRPKPSYVAGLTADAAAYVAARSEALSASRLSSSAMHSRKTWVINGLSAEVCAAISQTNRGRLIQDAFGFVGAALKDTVFDIDDIQISSGETLLICGASGSGKSLLLEALGHTFGSCSQRGGNGPKFSGAASSPARVVFLRELNPELTPIDQAQGRPLEAFLRITARCGLAEPQLLVRPTWTLSSGQRYRLQLALAVLDEPEILCIDNFCEALDRFSARAVCRGLTSLARDFNFAAVVATAAYDRLDEFFRPSSSVMLRRGDWPLIWEGGSE